MLWSGLPVWRHPAPTNQLRSEVEHGGVGAQEVDGVALLGELDQDVERLAWIRLRQFGLDACVLEADGEVVRPVAGGNHDVRLVLELLEIHVPYPGDVGAISLAVVQADDEFGSFGQVDGRAHRLVEAGGVLGQHENEVAAAKIDAFLSAKGRPK